MVSGHVPPDDPRSSVDWAALARANTTLVLLMAIKYLPQITERLLESGLPAQTPTAVISDGSLPGQEALFAPLGRVAATVAAQDVVPPAIVVIGEVTALHLHSAQASDGAAPQDGGQ